MDDKRDINESKTKDLLVKKLNEFKENNYSLELLSKLCAQEKDNADFLSIKYPKTADVFFKMSQRYVYDSDLERRRAENGYF